MLPTQQFFSTLVAEHTAWLKFVGLLEQEQAMLVENLTDQLLMLSEQKSADALNLNQMAETRRVMLQKIIPQFSVAGTMVRIWQANPLPAESWTEFALPPDIRHAGSLGSDAIEAWLETNSPQSLAIWQKIRNLADRAQQLNHTNGELIQMKLRHNQQSLAVLSNAVDKANLCYGPDGQTNFSPVNGRSWASG